MPRFQSIRPKVAEAVEAAQATGVHVTIATGRMFAMVLPYAQELGLTTPLIAHHGAFIKNPISGEVLFHRGVPLPQAHEVIELARQRELPVAAYVDDVAYTDKLRPEWAAYPWLITIGAREVGDLASFLKAEPTRMAIVSEPEYTRQLVIELRDYFGSRLHVTSGHPLLVEMSHPDVSKALGLTVVAEHLGVDCSEVIAVGDDWNDIEMLTAAGLGVAMADSPPEVRAAADYVAPSAEDDGAAHVLEKFILSRPSISLPRRRPSDKNS